jgi:phosphate:Na+ symporter
MKVRYVIINSTQKRIGRGNSMGIMNVLQLIAGLAFFLFGMNEMGVGLEKTSGGKLERLLGRLTSNRVKGLLLGAAVTAVIQSSSATTVMVVGFVNSGIMKLSQAIGVIMGANVGTTITAWVLSLTAIEGDSAIFQLLKPETFAAVFGLIGVILIVFLKSDRKKHVGSIFIGFAILMFGMKMMSDAIKPLANLPEFGRTMTMFTNPVLGMLVGAVLTAVIQSSSASVGILQALCATGTVSFSVALPVIMGQNIGTCVTALISSIGANKNARRAALVHLYFNVIGTVFFMIVIYSVKAAVNLSFFNDTLTPAGVATIHSIFNITTALLLLPLTKFLEKLAYLTLPDKTDELLQDTNEFKLLDVRFLDKTAVATQQARSVAIKMAEITKRSLFKAMGLLKHYNEEGAEEVCQLEERVDKYEDELGTYLVRLSSKNLSEKDSKTISILLHCIGDFERISDHATNIMQAAREMHEKELAFSKAAMAELKVFTAAIEEIVSMAFDVFTTENIEKAKDVEPLEEVIDKLNESIKKRHIHRLRNGQCTIELGFILSDIINTYERVADHCSNVAIWILHARESGFDTHGYIERIRNVDSDYFEAKYREYKEKYLLPQASN